MISKVLLFVAAVILVVASSMSIRMGNKIESWYADPVADVGVSSTYAKNAKNINVVVLLTSLVGLAWSVYKLTPAATKDQMKQFVAGGAQ